MPDWPCPKANTTAAKQSIINAKTLFTSAIAVPLLKIIAYSFLPYEIDKGQALARLLTSASIIHACAIFVKKNSLSQLRPS
jgi:hypothetical protein